MRVMVLGAGGFVGSAIVRHALARGWSVGAVSRATTNPERLMNIGDTVAHLVAELSDPIQIAHIVEKWQPQAIVQAAFTAGHGASDPTAQITFFHQGISPALALAQALQAVRFEGVLVHAGSAMSFGATGHPHTADDRLSPSTPRGVVKACCALLYEQAALTTGFRLCELFIYSIYGPFEQRGRLIPELLRAGLGNEQIKMTSRGFLRNWIHIDDVAAASLCAIENAPQGSSRVLVGSDCSVATTHEVVRLLETITGRSLVQDYTLSTADHYGDQHLSLNPLPGHHLIGWMPKLSLEAGLRHTWAWANSSIGRRYLLGALA